MYKSPLQQSLHRQVHSALSSLFPQLAKSSQKQGPTCPIRIPQRFAHSGVAPGLGETRLFGGLHKPQGSGGGELQPCDPSWQSLALGGTGLPRDGDPLRQVELGLPALPNLSRIEGCPFFVQAHGIPSLAELSVEKVPLIFWPI